MAVAFICGVALLFALVLLTEGQAGRDEPLRPIGLLRWIMSGNWTAKLGALLLTIGSGALLRYLMLNLTYPPALKILSGVGLAAMFGVASAVLAGQPRRRAISLALTGAALAVTYLTAYSAYAFFHYVADPQALGLLFIVAAAATVVAVTRRALSIAVLAMAGAYLAPAFALHSAGPVQVYGYYAAASLVTLGMVWLRGWRPLIHLSFIFTLGGALFFAWTQKFYTPAHYSQMQPLLLLLVAIHLAMPLLERGSAQDREDAGAWIRRFDQAYFLALPLVGAALTLVIAPRFQHEGAVGMLALALLWLAASGWVALRSRAGTVRYLAVALALLLFAAILGATDVPVFLIAAVLASLAVAAGPQLKLAPGAESLAIGAALAASACYVLQSLFEPASGIPLLNLPCAERLLLGGALAAAAWSLHRRDHTLAGLFAVYAGSWLLLTLARELLRLHFGHAAELLYAVTLAAIAACIIVAGARARAPNRLAILIFGIALFATGIASAGRFPAQWLIPLLLAGQVLFSLLALACDRHDAQNETGGAIARSGLPLVALPWAVALSQHWAAPNDDLVLTILVTSALAASLQAQWLGRNRQLWPNWLSPIGFTLFAIILFYETLCHIEREAWSVAFELIALAYLVETARFLWISRNRDAAVFGYVATAAVAAVSAAMLLRAIGPPGILTILALNDMVLPAVVSLLWAAIGGSLTWLSTRKQSRMLWTVGAVLMLAAALKLILLDFGSLGQITNIIAMMAAGGVFLLVAWLAPFPPKAAVTARPGTVQRREDGDNRGWLWLAAALIVLLAYGYRYLVPSPHPSAAYAAVPQPVSTLQPARQETAPTPLPQPASAPTPDDAACGRFARALPSDYLVFAAGDAVGTANGPYRAGALAQTVVRVDVNAPDSAVVLAFGSAGPTLWQVHAAQSANVVGVILSGIHRSTVTGLPANLPVLHAAFDDHQPCGYFQINPDAPQGANTFVSRLLVHAVDGNFQADGLEVLMGGIAAPPEPAPQPAPAQRPQRIDIDTAFYSSPRNGRTLEVTRALRSQCQGNEGFCTVRCGNQLAGDPDFGIAKVCQVTFACGGDRRHTIRFQEGVSMPLRCD